MSENDKRGLAGWLGLREPFDYSKARWLGPVLSGMVFLLFILAIASAGKMLGVAVFGDASLTPGNSLGIGAVTVALIGAPFVIWRSVVAQKSVDVQEQGHITDRINKAVEGLGAEKTVKRRVVVHETFTPGAAFAGKRAEYATSEHTEPNLEVRIGAIYALERISQDSARDHIQIMEILCAYIRENAKLMDPFAEELLDPKRERVRLRSDIDAAIKVIGRRPAELIQEARAFFSKGIYRKRFDLRGVDLCGSELQDLAFHDIEFNGSSFQRANLMNTLFDNVTFNYSDFSGAITWKANAKADCTFSYCLFSGLESLEIIMPLKRDRVLWCAVRDTKFACADLRELLQEKLSLLSIWFGDQSVYLPNSVIDCEKETGPSHWPQSVLDIKTFVQQWRRWQKEGPDYKPPE